MATNTLATSCTRTLEKKFTDFFLIGLLLEAMNAVCRNFFGAKSQFIK